MILVSINIPLLRVPKVRIFDVDLYFLTRKSMFKNIEIKRIIHVLEHAGKTPALTYEARTALSALAQQAAHGPLAQAPPERAPPPGAFDVVGKDRRLVLI